MSNRTLGSPWPVIGVGVSLAAAFVTAVATLMPIPSGPPTVPGLDKLWHFLAFFGIALPVGLTSPRWSMLVIVLSALYGGAIELIQPSVGRSAEWLDFLANITGALVGSALGHALNALVRARIRRRAQPA